MSKYIKFWDTLQWQAAGLSPTLDWGSSPCKTRPPLCFVTASPRTAHLLPMNSRSALSCLNHLRKKNKPEGRPKSNSPSSNGGDHRGNQSPELSLAALGCVCDQRQSQSIPSPIFYQLILTGTTVFNWYSEKQHRELNKINAGIPERTAAGEARIERDSQSFNC